MSAPICKKKKKEREKRERMKRGSKAAIFLILNTEHLSLEIRLHLTHRKLLD